MFECLRTRGKRRATRTQPRSLVLVGPPLRPPDLRSALAIPLTRASSLDVGSRSELLQPADTVATVRQQADAIFIALRP